ncbi:MAG: AtpZ/AtpI family protein [Anaerolineales bacterium]|nr:AtpZ/AtpI family protein [Anaerolineales bacterium]
MSIQPDRNKVVGIALASTVSQVGCVTVVIIIGALLVGLWLDNLMNTKPILTIVFILVSIPVSLFSIVRISLSAAKQLNPTESGEKPEQSKELE